MMKTFENWNNVTESEQITIDTSEVSSLREYRDRRAYSGFNDVTEISMKNGDKFVVYGHIVKSLRPKAGAG